MPIKDFNKFNESEKWSASKEVERMTDDSEFREYMHNNWGDAYHTPEHIEETLAKNKIEMVKHLKRVEQDSSDPRKLKKWVDQYIEPRSGTHIKIGFGKYPTAGKYTSYVLTYEIGGFHWGMHSNYDIKVGGGNYNEAQKLFDIHTKSNPNFYNEN